MRKLILTLTLGWLVSATSGCAIPGYSGDPSSPGAGSDLHLREPSPHAGRMGAVLVARPAGPHDALPHAWRLDLNAALQAN